MKPANPREAKEIMPVGTEVTITTVGFPEKEIVRKIVYPFDSFGYAEVYPPLQHAIAVLKRFHYTALKKHVAPETNSSPQPSVVKEKKMSKKKFVVGDTIHFMREGKHCIAPVDYILASTGLYRIVTNQTKQADGGAIVSIYNYISVPFAQAFSSRRALMEATFPKVKKVVVPPPAPPKQYFVRGDIISSNGSSTPKLLLSSANDANPTVDALELTTGVLVKVVPIKTDETGWQKVSPEAATKYGTVGVGVSLRGSHAKGVLHFGLTCTHGQFDTLTVRDPVFGTVSLKDFSINNLKAVIDVDKTLRYHSAKEIEPLTSSRF